MCRSVGKSRLPVACAETLQLEPFELGVETLERMVVAYHEEAARVLRVILREKVERLARRVRPP